MADGVRIRLLGALHAAVGDRPVAAGRGSRARRAAR